MIKFAFPPPVVISHFEGERGWVGREGRENNKGIWSVGETGGP